MAVQSIRSNVSEKIKKISKKQKELIKESLYTKGELPILAQIFVALLFWFLIFLILAVFLSPTLKWLGVIIALVGAFLIVQAMNFLGRRFVKQDQEEEETELPSESIDITENSVLLGKHYKRGRIVLIKNQKGKLSLTPILLLQILSVSSSSTSIFTSLSTKSLQRLSLKYHCSIIDTAKYELILLKGEPKKCKNNTLNITLKLLDDSFFQGAFDIISEFQRDKRIEFEFPQTSILREVFPTYGTILSSTNGNEREQVSDALEEISEASELEVEARRLYESFTNLEQDELEENIVDLQDKETEEIEEQPVPIQKTKLSANPKQEQIVKDVLLRELNFSLDSFLNAVKGYYKKGIENNLDKKYDIETDKFLKYVHLFCDKEEITFFYPSYSYLLKIIEFLDIELPSSTDIDNFTTKLAEEYVNIDFSENHKEKLKQFLDSKITNPNKQISENFESGSKVDSIPPPPVKKQQNIINQEEIK